MKTNRTKIKWLIPVVLASFFLFSCKTNKKIQLKEMSSNHGIPGTIIQLKGANFNAKYYMNEVTVGGGKTKVISGTDSTLKLVLLRDVNTGKVVVKNLENNSTDTANQLFERKGSTTQATTVSDADAELVVGRDPMGNTKYDMAAQGVDQPILIVLAQPSDITNPDSAIYFDTAIAANARDYLVQRAMQSNTFFKQASYDKTSANFVVTPTWIPLSQTRDFYMWQSEDVTRAQNALDGANAAKDALLLNPGATQAELDEAEEDIKEKEDALELAQKRQGIVQEPDFYYAEALIGAKAAMPNFDDFGDYVVVCAGPFLRGSCCWRENGYHAEHTLLGLNFDIDFNAVKGGTYVAQGTHWGRLGHELSHFFAGGDLYPSGSTQGTAGRYAFMGNHDRGPLYIGYNMEKRLGYYHKNNLDTAIWGSSPTLNQTYDIVAHTKAEDNTADDVINLLSIKVTEGMYYHVEVRQRPDTQAPHDYIFDARLPLGSPTPAWQGGVLVSRAIEENNQNNNQERMIQIMPPRRLIQVGESVNDPARTLKITVEQKLADRPLKYRVRLEWGTLPSVDPNGQFDLRITPWGAPPWETPDIWANSLKNDETSPARIIYKNHEPGDETKPIGNGDAPWVGEDNYLYARVRNTGVSPTPEDVKVSFYINTPPGVGDDGNWTPFDEVNVGILGPNADTIVRSIQKWTPSVGEHTCVKVLIHKINGEVSFNNNEAQENFFEFESESGSPFKAFEFQVDVRNPYDKAVIMDMKARDVPRFWNAALEHGSLFLQPKEIKRMNVVVWSDLDHSTFLNQDDGSERKYNRKPLIGIEGWVDHVGHSYFPVGGVSALVQNVLKSEISLKAEGEASTIQGGGAVTPNTKDVPVIIHAVHTDGTRHTIRTITDATGKYKFALGRNQPLPAGEYSVTAYIEGGSVLASAQSQTIMIKLQ